MPSRWEWKGHFSLMVPDGWTVQERENVVELLPPEPVGAITISVLRRTAEGHVKSGEATALVSSFVRGRADADVPVRETRTGGEVTASAAFHQSEVGEVTSWLVEARVWASRALLVTCCYSVASPATGEAAREVFASIQPSGGRL